MLVVDASCLFEVVTRTRDSGQVRSRMAADDDHAAPCVIDVEVLSVIRRDHLLGRLDATGAERALEDLRAWPGERFEHRALLQRAWQLRDRVRTWDAMYVSLAEVLGATLITMDERLASASNLRCPIELVPRAEV